MARTFITAFRADGASNDPATAAAAALDGVYTVGGSGYIVLSGTARKFFGAALADAAYITLPLAALTSGYVKFWTGGDSIGANVTICGADSSLHLVLRTDLKIDLYNNTTLIGTSSVALSGSGASCVEFRITAGSSVPVLKINGETALTASPSGWSWSPVMGWATGPSFTCFFYLYSVVVDNSEWPGPGFVSPSLFTPTSDVSVTNWTAGAGGASNLFQGCGTPKGVASASETDTTNIESASKVTNSYVCDIPSNIYSGLLAPDRVWVQYTLIHGEDISTGAKTGTFEATNPTLGAQSFTFGADGGAHVAYVDAGSKWSVSRWFVGPVPAPTSAPRITLTKTDGTTRVGCVCTVAAYVEYEVQRIEARDGLYLGVSYDKVQLQEAARLTARRDTSESEVLRLVEQARAAALTASNDVARVVVGEAASVLPSFLEVSARETDMSVAATDDFNRANSSDKHLGSPDWTQSGFTGADVWNSQAWAAWGNSDNVCWRVTGAAGEDQWAEFKVAVVPSEPVDQLCRLAARVRFQTGTPLSSVDGGFFAVGSSRSWYLSTPGGTSTTSGDDIAVGDIVRVEAQGAVASLFVNGQLRLQRTDATVQAGTWALVMRWSASALVVGTVDDFACGLLVPTASVGVQCVSDLVATDKGTTVIPIFAQVQKAIQLAEQQALWVDVLTRTP